MGICIAAWVAPDSNTKLSSLEKLQNNIWEEIQGEAILM